MKNHIRFAGAAMTPRAALSFLLLCIGFPPPSFAAGVAYGAAMAPLAGPYIGDMAACRDAAARAEQEEGLPAGLLLAIGQQESGRRDIASGEVTPWPYATNSAGESRFFRTSAEAIDHVATQRRLGVQSIDVGCFQINLQHHPGAFASLSEAFDPLANARYAAHFLVLLHAETGSWEVAVGRYHSATYSLAGPYTAAVFNFWHQPFGNDVPQVQSAKPWRQLVAGVIVHRPGTYSDTGGWFPSSANLPRVITPAMSGRSAVGSGVGRM